MSKYLKILGTIGYVCVFVAISMLLPAICALFYKEYNVILAFIIPAFISAGLGVLAIIFTKKHNKAELCFKYSAVTVVFCWIIVIFIGSFPFIFAESISFTNAFFESSSGWTTTGLSVMDVTAINKSVLLWRSLTQFLGGIGVILVLQLLIPSNQTTMLYQAEGHSERVLSNMRKTLKLIIGIYCLYTFIGIILYIIGGMSVFDAVNHSMTALATGGFSTKAASIGAYNSIFIECVTIFLMLLGGINFAIHILIFTGQFKKITKIFELKVMGIFLIIFIPLISFVGFGSIYANAGEQFRAGIFDTISVMTSTGFTIKGNAGSWSGFLFISFIILMLIGCNLGSTSGGIKQYRVGIAVKSFYWNIKTRLMGENKVYQPYIYNSADKQYLTQDDISKNNTQILLTLFFWVAGSLFISAFGFSMEHSLFEFASIVGNTGISFGLTASAPPVVLWFMSIGMLLGRLEFIIVFVAFGKIFSDSYKGIKNLKQIKEALK